MLAAFLLYVTLFYILDPLVGRFDIKLEHWERSERVANEVRRKMVRRLMEAGVYNNL